VQLQRLNSALLYTAGCPEPYYISLSRVESEPVAGHPCLDRSDTVIHQFSRLWWVSMAIYLKVVSVRLHTEYSVLNKLDDISGIQYEKNRTQDGPLWNATRLGHHLRRFPVIANKLRAPGQIRKDPVQCSCTKTLCVSQALD